MKPKLFKVVTLIVLVSITATAVAPNAHTADVAEPSPVLDGDSASFVEQVDVPHKAGPVAKSPKIDGYQLKRAAAEPIALDEPGVYILQLWDPPLALYEGGVSGIEATNPAARGETKLDAESAVSVAYMGYLQKQQTSAIAEIDKALGRSVDTLYQYKASLNGFVLELTPVEAATVASLESIKHIEPERTYELQTDAGPNWMGASGIWNGSATGGLGSTLGEGIIVGVIDTGIDPWNPSFADIGGDGYNHTNPEGAGNYVGVCDPTDVFYDPSFACNDKLIGARGYASVNGGDPRDKDGHGSHTSSTAAGNFVFGTSIQVADGSTFTADISGVAPHANIIMYSTCGPEGCPGSALAAAREDALLDGVDVINYSIGTSSPTSNPWLDAEAQQWLALRAVGIFVATSNGNSGPADETTGSPADLPWLTSVGASSHNRSFLNTLVLTNGNPLSSTLTIVGQSMTGALLTPAQVVYSTDYANPPAISEEDARLCAPGVFPSGTFSGEIVVCERGEYARVAKGQSVADGGAGGFVLAQPDEFGGGPGAVASDPHVLPALHIDWYAYQDLQAYVGSAPVVSGTITGSVKDVNASYGDIMAAFSSRGGNGAIPDYVVPDVTAPGRDIWAAYAQGSGGDGDYTYNVIQGTSMSSPHVAGAYALIKALHPEWSPAEAQSAVMTTARDSVLNDDGINTATPFAQGAGHADLTKAARAGLVLEVTESEYQAADPAMGGDPIELNLASLGNSQCLSACSWTRTLSSTLSNAVTWTASTTSPTTLTLTVDPSAFTLSPGGTQVVTVTADVSALPIDEWAFGTVTLTPSRMGDLPPVANLPVAVQPTSGVLPDVVEINTRRNAGSHLVEGLETLEVTDLTVEVFGLTQAGFTTEALYQDPTNDDPYDNLNDGTTFYITETVPSGAKRLVAEIITSEAVDIDLYVGQDLNGNGPEPSEQLCASTTPSWWEFCDLREPVEGKYWILVQNWEASSSPPDKVTLATAVVPGTDAGNMMVTGPTSVPDREPFDVRVFWDAPGMRAGDHWYGAFSLGADAGHPGNIGTVPVNIIRHEDDVVKTVSPDAAMPGDTVSYTIEVRSNVTPEDLTYHLTDTIPAGLIYVPGSASATSGAVNVTGNQITWTGVQAVPAKRYVVTTNATDPLCDTRFGGYVDLEASSIFPQANLSGDSIAWTAFGDQNPIQFYGVDHAGYGGTSDGFGFYNLANLVLTPNTPLPDPAHPNEIMPVLWNDLEIVYDGTPGSVRGVSFATAGPEVSLTEYDDVEPWPAGSTSDRYDFEVFAFSTIDDTPGFYEIVYAYDNFVGSPISVTVGVENADGTLGTEFLFGDPSGIITDGLIICFDFVEPSLDPVLITYQATVDVDAVLGTFLVNEVQHDTDNPGSIPATTDAPLLVSLEYRLYMPVFVEGSEL